MKFDASVILTFSADDLDHADTILEGLEDILYEQGVALEFASIEESILTGE